MAIKIIEYTVDIAGVTPAAEQFAGTQGDHRVTKLNFTLLDELYNSITNATTTGKAMYRFDIYDGEGGIWQSEPCELNGKSMQLELEERHTRFGGKITVYLVLTVLSEDSVTETELYSFPAVLRLNNRAEGTYQNGENYESVTGLVEVAKVKANEAAQAAQAAVNTNEELQDFAAEVEEKLKNGEFDGADGVSVTHRWDGTVLTVTSASGTSSADLKGEKGEKGDTGERGPAGNDAVADQTYNPTSQNAQSGTAVAAALQGYVPKKPLTEYNAPFDSVIAIYNSGATDENDRPLDTNYFYRNIETEGLGLHANFIVARNSNGNIITGTPTTDLDCANKKYVDDIVGEIETLLGGI